MMKTQTLADSSLNRKPISLVNMPATEKAYFVFTGVAGMKVKFCLGSGSF